jgi:hypothetical protein
MIRLTLKILILFLLVTGSCTRRENRASHKNLIPVEDLVPILTDIYIADGLLFVPEIHVWFSSLDSMEVYSNLIETHGYKKEDLDRTIKYYFVEKPKKLVTIYDQVLGELSELEAIIENEGVIEEEVSVNHWTGKEFFSFPDPTGTDSTFFGITLKEPGIYSLSFLATLFPDDQSLNARLTAYTCHPDSIETGRRNYFKTINYIKDGNQHNYYLIIRIQNKKPLHLYGQVYDIDNMIDEWGKHFIIENFSVNSSVGAQ